MVNASMAAFVADRCCDCALASNKAFCLSNSAFCCLSFSSSASCVNVIVPLEDNACNSLILSCVVSSSLFTESSWLTVSSYVVCASCAASAALEYLFASAEAAAPAAIIPSVTAISGFAASVAINPRNAPARVTVAPVAVPSAVASPIDASAADASASVIPALVRMVILWAFDNASDDNTACNCDFDKLPVREIRV